MAYIRSVLAIVATGLLAAGAAAQTPPVFDMKGSWKGNNEALVDGPATHHPPGVNSKPAGPYRLRQQMITYKFDGQEGKRFWGTMSSEQQANIRLLGTLSTDGKWIYMVSKEGVLDGQVIDPDTIEMCYRHANETSAVIGCNVMKRQK
jgi:hypothetical protein